jgi:hypothetical protein
MNLLVIPQQLSFKMVYNFNKGINFFGNTINTYSFTDNNSKQYIGFYTQEVVITISGGSGNYSYDMASVDQYGNISPQTYPYSFPSFPYVLSVDISTDSNNIHFLFVGTNIPNPMEINSTTLIRLVITDTTTKKSIPCPIILSWGPVNYFGNNEILSIDGTITNQDYTMCSNLLADSYDNTNYNWSSIFTVSVLTPIGFYFMRQFLKTQIFSTLASVNEMFAEKIIKGETAMLFNKTFIVTINDNLSSNAVGYKVLADNLSDEEYISFADDLLSAARIFRFFL